MSHLRKTTNNSRYCIRSFKENSLDMYDILSQRSSIRNCVTYMKYSYSVRECKRAVRFLLSIIYTCLNKWRIDLPSRASYFLL